MAAYIEPRHGKTGTTYRVWWRWNSKKRISSVWGADLRAATAAKRWVDDNGDHVSVQAVEDAILGEVDPGKRGHGSGPTLAEWADRWLARRRLTDGTRSDYRADLDNTILPALGPDVRISSITREQVDLFLEGLRPRYAASTRTNFYALLHAMLNTADEEKLLPEGNPARRTDGIRTQLDPEDEGSEPTYLDDHEVELLKESVDQRYRPVIELLDGTGVRISEALAAQCGAILLDAMQIHIKRAFKKDGKGGFYIGTTKTGTTAGRYFADRRIAVEPELIDALKPLLIRSCDDRCDGTRHSTACKARRDGCIVGGCEPACGRHVDRCRNLLFTAPAGGPIIYGNFYHRVWVPAVLKARRCAQHPPQDEGVPTAQADLAGPTCGENGGTRSRGDQPCEHDVKRGWNRCSWHIKASAAAVSTCECIGRLWKEPTPHDLRHTHAKSLLLAGVPMAEVSRRLGHSNIATTDRKYGRFEIKDGSASVAALRDRRTRMMAAKQPVKKSPAKRVGRPLNSAKKKASA